MAVTTEGQATVGDERGSILERLRLDLKCLAEEFERALPDSAEHESMRGQPAIRVDLAASSYVLYRIPHHAKLTKRESEVATLVAQGLPNKAIARELNLSVSTVTVHLRSIFRRLGVNSRVQMVRRLFQTGPEVN